MDRKRCFFNPLCAYFSLLHNALNRGFDADCWLLQIVPSALIFNRILFLPSTYIGISKAFCHPLIHSFLQKYLSPLYTSRREPPVLLTFYQSVIIFYYNTQYLGERVFCCLVIITCVFLSAQKPFRGRWQPVLPLHLYGMRTVLFSILLICFSLLNNQVERGFTVI